MDEARRFLRYVTPGLVFLTETLILLFVIKWDVASRIVNGFKKESGVGLVIATLLASGGVGFIFSVLHHLLHWLPLSRAVDHRQCVASLRARRIIRLRDRTSGEVLADTVSLSRFQAWSILTGLWHERLSMQNSFIKAADPRASSLSDLVHSIGTARVAASAAWITALYTLWRECAWPIEWWRDERFVVGNLLAAFFVGLYHAGYRMTGKATQKIVEQVLDDALTGEQRQKLGGCPN
jgi:hypothetical protein